MILQPLLKTTMLQVCGCAAVPLLGDFPRRSMLASTMTLPEL
jgi:hypothetical protein